MCGVGKAPFRYALRKHWNSKNMAKKRDYRLIDKEYITEGATTLFDIYELNEDKKDLTLFIAKDKMIDGDDKIKIRESRSLYIPTEQQEDYDNYCALHLRTIAQSVSIPFEVKSSVLYSKAEKVMTNLFDNPDALGNAELARDVVNDMLFAVLDNDFTVQSMMTIAAHDYYTHTHSINVSIYSLSLGRYLGMSEEDLKELGESALLHDLGKSKVCTSIINKNGKLDDTEFGEMMNHPAWGHELAVKLGITNKRVLSGIRHHHEKMNGTGYPDKLPEPKISQFARIIGVCDVFDALTTKRSYKDPMTSFNAFKLIKNQMQGHLDMNIVNSMVKMLAQTA
jgi:HD-GYP domain-containing protein (c-di-GMP phosphodiesterase class II)